MVPPAFDEMNRRKSGPVLSVELRVRGVVQGVGFRPFVYRIAVGCGLAGSVTNGPGAVRIEVEGDREAIRRLRRLLREEAPPAARIVRISAREIPPAGHDRFTIAESRQTGTILSTIPPDIATCPACRAELRDPGDRRHGYPFINCTNCGPRFTIVSRLPYDRGNSSMSRFPLCRECRREYEDPRDRRFHAEPNACPACGPSLAVHPSPGEPAATGDPVGAAAEALCAGRIAAIRGLGGFHLAADATDETAVRALRDRKFREEKPFAVMVRDLEQARTLAHLSRSDETILGSPSAPVLLAERKRNNLLAPSVSGGFSTVGIFLPYTPLHHLLLARAGRPLVMTSGNRTDEPIATGNDEALERLSGIADFFLLHDREIVQRSDDSVVRRVGRGLFPIRRARGFVPAPVVLRRGGRRGSAVAGLGAEIKSTFCILKGNFAYLSQHLGDLEHPQVREFYGETFGFFRRFLDADLAAVCRDLHPAYFTTGFAGTIPCGRVIPLQHHKAHIYSLLAETGFSGKAVGVAFDGTGYGEDGAVWGGEFFTVDGMAVERAAHLAYFPLPGGDAAVREPWRTALSLLHETFGPREALERALRLFPEIAPATLSLLGDAIRKGVNTVPSSSCGRLFDGIAALSGVCRRAGFEGQAPMLLEGAIRKGKGYGSYPFAPRGGNRIPAVDWKEVVAGVVSDVAARVPAPVIARRFHDTIAEMILSVSGRLADSSGASTVLLSGGVFQNAYLLRRLLSGFRTRNLRVRIHREVPPNDGGISLGQAFYAARTIEGR